MQDPNFKSYDFRQALISRVESKWMEYLLFGLVGLGMGLGIQYLTAKWALPDNVKKELQILEKKKEKILDSKLPVSVKANYLERISKQKDLLLKDYPTFVWIGNINQTKYVKWKLILGYILSGVAAILPIGLLALFYKRKLEPIVFPKPKIQIPFTLGEARELIDFKLARIDKNQFKNLFKSDKDYELFWRIVNGSIVIEDKIYDKVLKSYMGEVFKYNGWKKIEFTGWKWKKALEKIKSTIKHYKDYYAKLGLEGKVTGATWDIEIRFPKDYRQVRNYQDLNRELNETPYILSSFNISTFLPKSYIHLNSNKNPISEKYPFLFAKLGAYNIEEISATIGRILSELENWARTVGVKLDEKFRARMGLAILLEIIPNFVKEKTIPKGLANRFLKDDIVKYVNSYISSGLLIKAKNEVQKVARDYLLVFHTYKFPHLNISVMDYLNLKYNLVFDVENEEKSKILKEKVKLYENYKLWMG